MIFDTEEELNAKIKELEAKKEQLISRITAVNKRLRYKKYEKLALEPFLQQTKDVYIGPLRKRKTALEFKISTQAYTPRIEKELIKELKKLEEELSKVSEVEKARRREKFVARDIEEAEKEVADIEAKLKSIREELKKLYDEIKEIRDANRHEMKVNAFKHGGMPTLADVGIIEKEK